jgi:hypothetical protein
MMSKATQDAIDSFGRALWVKENTETVTQMLEGLQHLAVAIENIEKQIASLNLEISKVKK